MNFQLFFLKEGTRAYEKSDLITLLKSNPNIIAPEQEETAGKKVYKYHHPVLNFDASFVMATKSVVPHLERIDAKYYDINFYLEFNVLLQSYNVELLLDLVQEICSQFKFKVYCESYQYEVKNYKRAEIMKNFNVWKRSYADKYPEDISKFNKLDSQTITAVYGYLQKRKRMELSYLSDNIIVSDYIFLKTEKSRSAFVAIKWDGETPFILPPVVDIFILQDAKITKYIPMSEVIMKMEKLFVPVDSSGITKLEQKNVKKLYKFLTKEKFAPLSAELKTIQIDDILDI